MKRLVLAFLAAAMMAEISCASRSPLPEGAELIPADTTFAVSLDVPAIVNSQLYKMYEANESVFGRNRMNFYQFAEATGLDPSKDIKRLLFIARAGNEGLEDMSALVIGSFDGRKVHDFLKSSGMPSRQESGMDIFEFIVIQDRCRFCLAVVDASTAAFGDGETLAKIARIKAGGMKGLSEEERAGRLLRRVGPSPEAWGILRATDFKDGVTQLLKRVSADSSALAALGPIEEVSFSFDTAEPMRVLLEMTATSDKDAMMVADVLKGAESLARLTLKEARPELGLIMSDMVIEADTGLVRVSGSIPSADVDVLARQLGAHWLPGRVNPQETQRGEPSP